MPRLQLLGQFLLFPDPSSLFQTLRADFWSCWILSSLDTSRAPLSVFSICLLPFLPSWLISLLWWNDLLVNSPDCIEAKVSSLCLQCLLPVLLFDNLAGYRSLHCSTLRLWLRVSESAWHARGLDLCPAPRTKARIPLKAEGEGLGI